MQGIPSDPARWVWLLGAGREQRLRLSQSLLAAALMLGSTLILLYAGALAATPARWLLLWGLVAVCWPLLTWVLIRSGWSLRLPDPSMTRWQIVWALLLGFSAYPMAGPLRFLVLPIVVLVLTFGMFSLRPGQALHLAWLALGLLCSAMLFAHHVWPRSFEPAHELGLLMMALVTLPGVAILAGRLARMRARLQQQRQALGEAKSRIEELAMRDLLTGLYNRRHGEELLRQALQRARRSGSSFSVAMIDIDHFKRFNDRFGHSVGDSVLRAFAQAAQSALRATDTLSRWGGEEFLLLLDDADRDAAAIALERIQVAVEQAGVEVDGQALGFSFSAGFTTHVPGETELLLLDRADRALYRAKAEGRNRVVSA